MRILTDQGWVGGYPDEHRAAGQLRIRVVACQPGPRIRGLYFEQANDPRRVWNYLREVGPVAVARKVASRRSESVRNDKRVCIGLGQVLEADDDAGWDAGGTVLYLAPAHPRSQERIVLDEGLCRPPSDTLTTWVTERGAIEPVLLPWEDTGLSVPAKLVAWNRHSGRPLAVDAAQRFLKRYEPVLEAAISGVEPLTPVQPEGEDGSTWLASDVAETLPPEEPTDSRLSATVMGYGHYAKISLIPNLDPALGVRTVHEVDPTQLGPGPHPFAVDTAPTLRGQSDVYFLAGFHHTHAPLATAALRAGAHAVIEKPIATTHEDLDALLRAMEESHGTVHVGFHKRYQPFNGWAFEDLEAEPGDPISYYAIAYEVPLPEHHWYRWPRSRSRLVSNGCHWIDHFLFLNHWSRPASWDVRRFPGGDFSVTITLENEAAFHMVLTDQGGARIGVQDHVELRRGRRTVRIRNGRHYESEDDRRVLRRRTENKTAAYRQMYATISSAIASGGAGDTRRSVALSGRIVLDLEDHLASGQDDPAVRTMTGERT